MAAEEAAEGLPEGHVAQRVAAGEGSRGGDGAVGVAEPFDDDLPEGGDHGQDVIGRPGDDDGQHDGQDGPGGVDGPEVTVDWDGNHDQQVATVTMLREVVTTAMSTVL